MVVDIGLIQPELLLVEVAVEVLVGGAGIVAAAGGDADAGVHLRVDLAVGAQSRSDALAVPVAAVVRLAADVDVLVAHPHITLDLGLGGPGQFLLEIGGLLLLGDLGGTRLLLLLQVAAQFGVLGRRDGAIGLEHVEQLLIDSGTRGGRAGGQEHAREQRRESIRVNRHRQISFQDNPVVVAAMQPVTKLGQSR